MGSIAPPGNTSRVLRGRLSPLPGIDISSWKEKYKLYYTLEWRHHRYDVISILAMFWKDPFCMIDLRYHQSWKSQNAFKIHEFSRTTNVTNAKPSTLAWPLDDKNIQFPTVSSKYNSIVTLAHRIFIPVEFGPKWWRHQPSFWAITPEEMNQFRCGFRHLIGNDILYPHAKYKKIRRHRFWEN